MRCGGRLPAWSISLTTRRAPWSAVSCYDALAHVVDGDAQITISGEPLTLTAGDMVILAANEPHAVLAISAFKMVLVMIRA
jgi:quercetin dioxygenase-like cupin family protein